MGLNDPMMSTMPALNQTETELPEAPVERQDGSSSKKQVPIRVYMMDLWSFIPYYMARLSGALGRQSVNVSLGSVRYHLDRNFFQTSGLQPDRLLLDCGGAIKMSFLRRLVKSLEYATNLFVLGLRLAVSRPDVLHVQYLAFLERGWPFEIWF